ncbi:MAG: hypothetical protein QW791_05235 [Candidatus Bathyarchaeia archaeon]
MVSWSRAFKAAALTILYWIVWAIIGGLIIVGGFYAMEGAISVSQTGLPIIDWREAIGGLVLIIIGYIVIMLGFYATIYKVLTEVIIDEVKGIVTPPTMQPTFQLLTPTTQEIEITCPICRAKNPQQATYCIRCGTKLKMV